MIFLLIDKSIIISKISKPKAKVVRITWTHKVIQWVIIMVCGIKTNLKFAWWNNRMNDAWKRIFKYKNLVCVKIKKVYLINEKNRRYSGDWSEKLNPMWRNWH